MTEHTWTDDYGQTLNSVHDPSACAGERCTLHNRSRTHTADWPQHWRYDRAYMEVMCPHDIGHPDPDDVYPMQIHACDGCCLPRLNWSVPLRVWACISTKGELNNEFRHADKEVRAAARQEALDMWMRFNDYVLHLESTHKTMRSAAGDNTLDFAKLADAHPDRAILMRLDMGGDVDEMIWAQLRPRG